MKAVYKILICIGACLAALLMPAVGLEVLLPPVIALAGFMAAEWSFAYLAPFILCGLAGFLLGRVELSDGVPEVVLSASLVCLMAAFALVTFAAAYCMRRRVPNRFALLAYAAILCVGIYLAMGLGSMLAGGAPYDGIVTALKRMDGEFESLLGSAYTASARENLGALIALVPDLLMAYCLLFAEVLAFCIFICGRAWYRAFHKEPVRMADISQWRLPKSIFAPSLAWTMGVAFVSLYAVQGLAYVYFIYRRVNASGGLRAVIWVFLVLFMPYSVLVLAVTGLIEQLTKKRSRIAFYEKQLALRQLRQDRFDEYEKYGYIRKDDAAPPSAEEKSSAEGGDTDNNDNTDNNNEGDA